MYYYLNTYLSYFRYADKVSVNDEVLVQKDNGLTPALVINTSYSVMQGKNNSCFKLLKKLSDFISKLTEYDLFKNSITFQCFIGT